MKNALVKTDFKFPGQKSVYHGKVRDVYNIDDELVMVVSDRISAFDVILPEGIPYKGQVLNQIAAKFLDATSDIVPNWKVATPDPMVTVGLRCEPFKVEMVVRGYLTGHAWREYKAGKRTLCGETMPEGMKENENSRILSSRRLPKPMRVTMRIFRRRRLSPEVSSRKRTMNSWRNIRWRCINEAARWLLKRGLFWWIRSMSSAK